MFVGQILIRDGGDMISYLDQKLQELASQKKVATGIIVSTDVRRELSRACQKVMGQRLDDFETVNRFRNVLLIEDGENKERLEVICGTAVMPPVEGNIFGAASKKPVR